MAGNREAERGETRKREAEISGEAGNKEAERGEDHEAGNREAENGEAKRGEAENGEAERGETGPGLLVIESRDQGRGWE